MKNSKFWVMPSILLALAFVFVGCDMSTVEAAPPIVDAAKPVISAQPEGASINVGEDHTMTVVAASTDGGRLAYQWFFCGETTDWNRNTGLALAGATGASYTPPGLGDGSYEYYVIVTNVNDNVTGRRRVSVQSELVQINVEDAASGNAVRPTIKTQPLSVGNVAWGKNMDLPELKVEATIGDKPGVISYQWYVASFLTNSDGEEIDGATVPVFRPIPTGPGEYYYFVVVYNTNNAVFGRRTSFVISNPAYVQVIVNPNAETPVITRHPQNAIYFSGDTVNALSVEAAEPDDLGTLEYQWYSNTANSNTGGTLIANATGATFTPPISTSTTGTYYYYVVVTNYNDKATTTKRVPTPSRVATLFVTTPQNGGENATFAVDMNRKLQFVRGFGGMDVGWGQFPNYTIQDYENMFDPDILGYNIHRIMILASEEDPREMLYKFTTNQLGGRKENFFKFMQIVNKHGGYIFASPWTPPAVWKSNNSLIGGELREMYYWQFANYLRVYSQAMADNGAPIYAVSISNEPNYSGNYDGARWTGPTMRDFFLRMGRFTKAGQSSVAVGSWPVTERTNWPTSIPGYGGGKARPHVMTMSGESANNINIHNEAMRDATARGNIDIIGRHPYGDRNTNMAGLYGSANANVIFAADAQANPTEIWQTEYNLNTPTNYNVDSTWNYVWPFMNAIDIFIRSNLDNAYVWWSAKRYYSMLGDGEYSTRNGEILPRGWGMAHYSKFANETYQVGLTITGNGANGTPALSAPAHGVAGTNANINPTNYTEVTNTAVKVSAFVKLRGTEETLPKINWTSWAGSVADDIEYISFVIFTPTGTNGLGGTDMGTIKLDLPSDFTIRGATAMRSTSTDVGDRAANPPKPPVWENVAISQDRHSAFVTLPAGQILSVKFTQ